MIKKMPKKAFPCTILIAAFVAMMLINIFAWNFSSIFLMLIAAVVSLVVYLLFGPPPKKEGEKQ